MCMNLLLYTVRVLHQYLNKISLPHKDFIVFQYFHCFSVLNLASCVTSNGLCLTGSKVRWLSLHHYQSVLNTHTLLTIDVRSACSTSV